ncbi:hypothetical protein HWV62_34815 [Athelia sp. TMB]|nr:hypothetical protein HWV62_34815 [Athelia sp. TMB]
MMLSSNIETGISQLNALEDDFFAAVQEGDSSPLLAFLDKFRALLADVETQSLPAPLLARLSSVSFVVGTISKNLQDSLSTSNTLTNNLREGCTEIFTAAGYTTTSESEAPLPNSTPPPNHPCPPYIASAYKWLRHHIHKPYPTLDEIHSISVTSNTSEKRIRNWFTTARQRMGWTKIAKQYFHGDREDTTNAATRALVQPDPTRPVDQGLMMEFVRMSVATEDMYSDVFKPTSFAGDLGTNVMAMSSEHQTLLEQMRQQVIQDVRVQKEVDAQMKKQRAASRSKSMRRSVSAYPSPERSPEPSLLLTDTEDDISESPAAGRKRTRSPSSSSSIEFEVQTNKRVRRDRSIDPAATLPSPMPSGDECLPELSLSRVSSIESLSPSTPPASKKRRLSDSQCENPYKRARGPGFVGSGPRLQAVSAPLPSTSAPTHMFDLPDFAHFDFEMPPAVTSQPPDASEGMDVHIFTDWPWGPNASAAQQLPSPVEQEDSMPSKATPPFDMSASLESAAFDQFLSEWAANGAQMPEAPAPSQSDVLSMDRGNWSRPFDINGSQDQSMNPIISSGPTFDGYVDFSNSITSFDTTMTKIQPAPSPADIIAQNEAESKAAKLEQLRALREAAQKLEEELIATSS